MRALFGRSLSNAFIIVETITPLLMSRIQHLIALGDFAGVVTFAAAFGNAAIGRLAKTLDVTISIQVFHHNLFKSLFSRALIIRGKQRWTKSII